MSIVFMEKYSYLIALCVMSASLVLIDYRLKIAFYYDWRRTLKTLLLAFLLFIIWDMAGITLNIFSPGASHFATQLRVAPKLPLEEPIFLFNFVYLTLILWRCTERYVHIHHS